MALQSEMQKLKENWLSDPCYDLENVEGFEMWRDELLQFRLETEAMWEAERDFYWQEEAQKMGIPGNVELARRIKNMELRIAVLEKMIADDF